MSAKLYIRSFSFATYTHLHDYSQLVIPIRGAADNFTEMGSGRIGPGQCIVFPKGCEHKFVPDEGSSFLVADMNELPPSLACLSHPVISIPPALQYFCGYVEKQLEYPISKQLYESMGEMFMTILEEQTFIPRLDPRIARVLEYFEKDISVTPSLATLAQVACLSVSQLKNLFKKETGQTTSQYLLSIRMTKARGLLAHTDTPVNIVANSVGYQDLSAFSHRFSVYFGHSPSNSRHQ
ncbi:hypothetical protein TW85_07305 [Marinomonas sp. S3726]|uniref:AraC family transcriptional regulator n=1 Tax=Marinomonas sp. S3726 TaxID=579484 RepID=UPI0005FA30C9|nr:AraC family transcriptional regulator [Marinomonas sp. S3726]KJZ14890.1 hypothetical protein TW85_07305 [Marinomonas sp. S3726]